MGLQISECAGFLTWTLNIPFCKLYNGFMYSYCSIYICICMYVCTCSSYMYCSTRIHSPGTPICGYPSRGHPSYEAMVSKNIFCIIVLKKTSREATPLNRPEFCHSPRMALEEGDHCMCIMLS